MTELRIALHLEAASFFGAIKADHLMRKLTAALIIFALTWRALRTFSDLNDSLSDERNWIELIIFIAGISISTLVASGKNVAMYLAKITSVLSVYLERFSKSLEKLHSQWDSYFDIFSPQSQKHSEVDCQRPFDPIKESYSTSAKPTFPKPIAITLALGTALTAAVLYLGFAVTNAPLIITDANNNSVVAKTDRSVVAKSDRAELPSTFADRFTLPQTCEACGGPDIEIVPLPKPHPLRKNNSRRVASD